jgi:hypothetical protein
LSRGQKRCKKKGVKNKKENKIQVKGNVIDEKPKRVYKKIDPRKLMEYVIANKQISK